jgi:heme/copper-type cytochrome/quinol oxidase subunit 2
MPDRSWFYADRGQQQGPFPEAQFRSLVANGTVRPDTLVWTEGMASWQRAGEIPGLMSQAARPPAVPGSTAVTAGTADGSLSIDFEILDFVGRLLLFIVGAIFIIPLPWVLVSNLKWLTSRTRVPGRPDLDFTGNAMTIVWWFLGAVALIIALNFIGGRTASIISFPIEVGLGWLAIRWFIANLASGGQPLGLSFSGSYLPYLGWNLLGALSTITIIGWAWVYTAQTRWICRNIQGTRCEIVFNATGLEYLWRAIVVLLGCAFIIPIPWVARWMMSWLASQTVLVERDAYASP